MSSREENLCQSMGPMSAKKELKRLGPYSLVLTK